MSILERFKDIMSSNINALLDKAENPEKMIDQYLLDAQKDLAMVRKETAGVIAEEKRAKKQVDSINNEIDKFENLAKKALIAGNREDASVFISKKQTLESELTSHLEVYKAAQLNSKHMTEMYNKLADDISRMQTQKNILKGKNSAAKARETVNKLGSNSARHGAVAGKMGRMSEKIDARFNQAMAESELLNEPQDAASALESKYKGGSGPSVDAELDALMAELGLTQEAEE